MPIRLSIKELLKLLHQNSDLIDLLFGKKESILTSEILAREEVTLDKMEHLFDSGIIHENNGYVSLDERLCTFFLDFLEIVEISIGFINDNVQFLNENLSYYRQEQNPKYVKKIKNTLQKTAASFSFCR